MNEPILPPDLNDLEAMGVYYTQLHQWIRSIKDENKSNKS